MADPRVLNTFPTEKYKRFNYPTRPLFTLCFGLVLLGLGWVGILPIAWALYLAAIFSFDDLPLTPILSLIKSVNNLVYNRKRLKSWVMILAISAAAIGGGLLAFFVLNQIPLFVTGVSTLISGAGSPILVMSGGVLGGLIARLTNMISPFGGMVIGMVVASLLPIPVPFMVDAVFVGAAGMAFIASIITKQAMRLIYKKVYGHTNADGYQTDKSETAQDTLVLIRAQELGMSELEFKETVAWCKRQITAIKQKAGFLYEMNGDRQELARSYKDIYHSLMTMGQNDQEIADTKKLLTNSAFDVAKRSLASTPTEEALKLAYPRLINQHVLVSNFNTRMQYHQFNLLRGHSEERVDPNDHHPCFFP